MKRLTSLKCPQCSDLLLEPRKLPCGQSICNYCVQTIEDTIRFKCVLCKSIHNIPSCGFPFDCELQQLANNNSSEIILTEEEKSFQVLLNQTEYKLKETEFELENGDHLIREYTDELKRQVQLAKEIKVQKLFQHSADMQAKLNEYQNDLMRLYLSNEQFIKQLNQMLVDEMRPSSKADQLKDFLKEFTNHFNLSEYEHKNSQDLKNEYCRELNAKIDMRAEKKVQILNNYAEEIILSIDELARSLTDRTLWTDKTHSVNKLINIKEKLKLCYVQSHSYSGKRFLLNDLHSKLATQRENQNFDGKIAELIRSNEDRNENPLGIKLLISEANQIDFNRANSISFIPLLNAIRNSVDFYKIAQSNLIDMVPVCLENKYTVIYISFKAESVFYPVLGENHLYQSISYNMYCILLDQEQTVKKIKLINVATSKILKQKDIFNEHSEDFYHLIRLESCSNKILINFCDDDQKHLYILDHDLEILKRSDTKDTELAGCNDSFIFMASRSHQLSPLYVYDWSMQLVNKLGQRYFPDDPFYFPFTLKQVKYRNGKYYIIEMGRENYLNIIDEKSGKCVSMSPTKTNGFILFFHIDSDNRLILIENQNNLIFMSPFGHNLKEIQLENRPLCADYSIDGNNTLYVCNKETKQLLIKKTNNKI